MFYTLPTAPPAMLYVVSDATTGAATIALEIAAECERGSRDCFPKDRVGYGTENIQVMALRP